jgi:streptomycin 6-kinase
MDLTDLATIGAASNGEIRSRCRQLADIADPIDADRLWLWCRAFAPLAAVSVARRTGKTEEITLMRALALTR